MYYLTTFNHKGTIFFREKFVGKKKVVTFAFEKCKNFFIVKVLVKWVRGGCEVIPNIFLSVAVLDR
jgi:hypothetical protein